MQVQNEVTLKSKLRADHRNADLQRRHGTLKEQAQHSQRALDASQVADLLVVHFSAVYAARLSLCRARACDIVFTRNLMPLDKTRKILHQIFAVSMWMQTATAHLIVCKTHSGIQAC